MKLLSQGASGASPTEQHYLAVRINRRLEMSTVARWPHTGYWPSPGYWKGISDMRAAPEGRHSHHEYPLRFRWYGAGHPGWATRGGPGAAAHAARDGSIELTPMPAGSTRSGLSSCRINDTHERFLDMTEEFIKDSAAE